MTVFSAMMAGYRLYPEQPIRVNPKTSWRVVLNGSSLGGFPTLSAALAYISDNPIF